MTTEAVEAGTASPTDRKRQPHDAERRFARLGYRRELSETASLRRTVDEPAGPPAG